MLAAGLVPACSSSDGGGAASPTGGACTSDASDAYPAGPYAPARSATLADATFDGVAADGTPRALSLHDYYTPCATSTQLLVLRATASWCGTCRWDAAHTKELLDRPSLASRVKLVDVVLANEDNIPASVADLPAWRARVTTSIETAVDPTFSLRPEESGPGQLPLYLIVDARTMKLRDVVSAPEPEWLASRLEQELAALDGAAAVPLRTEPTTDGLTRRQWDLIREMKAQAAPPPDPTNAKADDPAAAAMGARLYADTSFSPSGTVSCFTCHPSDKGFNDGHDVSRGVANGDRNAPAIQLSSQSRWMFWDGRADTPWAQAAGPFENKVEYDSTRLFVVHGVYERYRSEYEAIFGALPPLNDPSRFPPIGKPGDATWSLMTAEDQTAVTRVYVNVAKSIAAYERTLRPAPSALDRYVDGDTNALSPDQKAGLLAFFDSGCAQCHYGPRLTDDAFHNMRFPTGRRDGAADTGRLAGVALLESGEFSAGGPFSDAPQPKRSFIAGNWTVGEFKTPPLRGVAFSPPYGHGGTYTELEDALQTLSVGGLPLDDNRAVGERDPFGPAFPADRIPALAAFLRGLGDQP